MARLKFVRKADMPGAYSPDKVPSEEGKPEARPDSRPAPGHRQEEDGTAGNKANSMARLKGLEPLTHCLEGSCSIHLSYRRIWSGEGWDSTIELHPHGH